MSADTTIADILARVPVIPVLTVERVADAVPLARALVEGGLPVLEVTLRSEAAAEAAAAMIAQVPEAVVGLGPLTGPADVVQACEIGARFGVSPGLTEDLAATAIGAGLPFLPGVATPSEAMRAAAYGLTHLKLFPAEPAGGIPLLKALSGPFPDLRFCPTGGITAHTAPGYLALPNVACVGGSWLATKQQIAQKEWSAITQRVRQAVSKLEQI